MTTEQKNSLVEPKNSLLSIREQCALLELARSSYYYPHVEESHEDIEMKFLIDKINMDFPFYGSRKILHTLRQEGRQVNRKRVQRLMREMGLEVIYPKPRLSLPGETTVRFPYLLKDFSCNGPNQAWVADITYVPTLEGNAYCVAIMDWWSRYVLSWKISNSMDTSFCIEALEEALKKGKPKIFNTDQGSQFTSSLFVNFLLTASIKVSWDGRGRAFDNILIERLWRSYKYEEVYRNRYNNVKEGRILSEKYFNFYNKDRPHQNLNYQTPERLHYSF